MTQLGHPTWPALVGASFIYCLGLVWSALMVGRTLPMNLSPRQIVMGTVGYYGVGVLLILPPILLILCSHVPAAMAEARFLSRAVFLKGLQTFTLTNAPGSWAIQLAWFVELALALALDFGVCLVTDTPFVRNTGGRPRTVDERVDRARFLTSMSLILAAIISAVSAAFPYGLGGVGGTRVGIPGMIKWGMIAITNLAFMYLLHSSGTYLVNRGPKSIE